LRGAVIVVGHRRPVTDFDPDASSWAVAIVKPADWLARSGYCFTKSRALADLVDAS
jgi:hypothetical protein